eukprot:2561237-Prymnesium_polylepis.2
MLDGHDVASPSWRPCSESIVTSPDIRSTRTRSVHARTRTSPQRPCSAAYALYGRRPGNAHGSNRSSWDPMGARSHSSRRITHCCIGSLTSLLHRITCAAP